MLQALEAIDKQSLVSETPSQIEPGIGTFIHKDRTWETLYLTC